MIQDAKYIAGAVLVAAALSATIWWLAGERRGEVLILGAFLLAGSFASRDLRSDDSRLLRVMDPLLRGATWSHYPLGLLVILVFCATIGSIVAVAARFLPTWAEFALGMLLFFASFPVLFVRKD